MFAECTLHESESELSQAGDAARLAPSWVNEVMARLNLNRAGIRRVSVPYRAVHWGWLTLLLRADERQAAIYITITDSETVDLMGVHPNSIQRISKVTEVTVTRHVWKEFNGGTPGTPLQYR